MFRCRSFRSSVPAYRQSPDAKCETLVPRPTPSRCRRSTVREHLVRRDHLYTGRIVKILINEAGSRAPTEKGSLPRLSSALVKAFM
jgi:hypothetical protein